MTAPRAGPSSMCRATRLLVAAAFCITLVLAAPACGRGGGIGSSGEAGGKPLPGAVGDPCARRGAAATAGKYVGTVREGFHRRDYFVTVPRGYDPARPAPLVLAYHGGGGSPAEFRTLTRLDGAADRAGTAIVYLDGTAGPAGLKTFNAGPCCGAAARRDVDDIRYTQAVMADVGRRLCLNPERVYATGVSNGAFMAYDVACRLAGRIAAIAPVAGTLITTGCRPSEPVSVLHIHGTQDGRIAATPDSPPDSRRLPFEPATAAVAFWVRADRCPLGPRTAQPAQSTRCRRWSGCAGGTTVQLCLVSGGGHTWPGGTAYPRGGRTVEDLSASDMLLRFFAAQPPRRGAPPLG